MDMIGTDLNDDGVPDSGACIPRIGDAAPFFFWTLHGSSAQSRGTSQ